MPETPEVHVHINQSDLKKKLDAHLLKAMRPLLLAFNDLLRALANDPVRERLSEDVMYAADSVQQALVGIGLKDIGPPPGILRQRREEVS